MAVTERISSGPMALHLIAGITTFMKKPPEENQEKISPQRAQREIFKKKIRSKVTVYLLKKWQRPPLLGSGGQSGTRSEASAGFRFAHEIKAGFRRRGGG